MYLPELPPFLKFNNCSQGNCETAKNVHFVIFEKGQILTTLPSAVRIQSWQPWQSPHRYPRVVLFACIHFIYICLVFKAQFAAQLKLKRERQRQLPQWLATCHVAHATRQTAAPRRPHGQLATRQEFHYLHLLCNFQATFSIIHFAVFLAIFQLFFYLLHLFIIHQISQWLLGINLKLAAQILRLRK